MQATIRISHGVARMPKWRMAQPVDIELLSQEHLAIVGRNGSASKEQVAGMLRRLLQIPEDHMPHFLDATDALGAAYCHFMQMGRPESQVRFKGWKDYVNKNQERICRPPSK